ncbi:uncharacterized protein LOC120349994 [Nilaparvata lugens]|uniref:uncharacterized protein LOC120349994 n=1 Tax=Nilaparvata lugens TaxID=108931 RepID=UPI00193D8A5F|nr:uncharacterized protein LOC120349994 [Nilaparvata lugens]
METIVTNLQFFVESDITQYRLVSIVVGTRIMSAALLIDTNRKEELNSLKKSIKELARNRDLFDEVISKGGELAKQIAERKMKMFQRVKTLQKYNCYKIIFLNLFSSLFENALRYE